MSPTLVSYTVDANAAIYFTFSVLCEKLSILIYIQFLNIYYIPSLNFLCFNPF